MKDPYEDARRALEEATLHGPGKTPSSLRAALARRAVVPDDLRALADKIETNAVGVTDADIAALKKTYTEDEIFEIVVSTALGASIRRLEAGLRALDETEDERS